MKKDLKHIKYTAHDIERYNTGKMSAQEMHELEKAALEDTFLADAIEGYTYTTSANSDLTDLKHMLQQNITKERGKDITRISRQWLRVAALLLFLTGAGWFVYHYNFNNTESEIAQEDKSPQETDLQQQSTSSTQADEVTGDNNLQPDSQSVAITGKKGYSADKSKRVSSSSYRRESRSVNSYTNDEIGNQAPVVSSAPDLTKGNETNKSMLTRATKGDSLVNTGTTDSKIKTELTKTVVEPKSSIISGQVVNTKGEVLQNASVTINNSQVATVTDKQGYFAIRVKDSVVIATVAYVGYEANSVKLKNPDSINKIVLKESNASLSEVVVGYNGRRKSANLSENNKALPEPSGGWRLFEEYLSKNLKNDSKMHGEVHLSFNINKQGAPEKIKVEIPLCSECDKEAIRLLKDGPKWKKANDNRGRVAIVF
jgi:hypothetical protein